MTQNTASTEAILAQRGPQYGDFTLMSALSQQLKNMVYTHADHVGNQAMGPVHCEAMDMILLKIARIANGNPNNVDSWDDIAGYAKLVADIIRAAAARAEALAAANSDIAARAEADAKKEVSNTDADKRAAALNVSAEVAEQMTAHAAAVVAAASTAPVSHNRADDTPPTAPATPPSGSDDGAGTLAPATDTSPAPVPTDATEVAHAADPFPGSDSAASGPVADAAPCSS